MNQNMMEGVLRSAWDAFYFFAIACVLSENQLKLVLESHRLVIEFSHKCLGTIQDVFTDTYLLLNKKKKNLKEPGNVDEQSIMLLLENFFIEE